MSSDNYYYVTKDNEVYMGFASSDENIEALFAPAMAAIKKAMDIVQHNLLVAGANPLFSGETQEEALQWAFSEYSEYGVTVEPDDLWSI